MCEEGLLCQECGCPGEMECNYPPRETMDCKLDDHLVCGCCANNIDRMSFRSEEDGQIELLKAT